VWLSRRDYVVDWKSLAFVFVDEPYAAMYEEAVVLDLGAHKGYFGAYALAHGASVVVSFEPESSNLEYLARAAGSLQPSDGAWHLRRSAVGARPGEASLHVMGASWGHALDPPSHFAEYEIGRESVHVEAFADILAEWRSSAAKERLVVKLNIEGAECATVLETPRSALEAIDEVFVETHPWASCDADGLASHLGSAGLTRAESGHPAVLRMLRREAARDGRRSDPSRALVRRAPGHDTRASEHATRREAPK
jgi:FkbM family methyltransferase